MQQCRELNFSMRWREQFASLSSPSANAVKFVLIFLVSFYRIYMSPFFGGQCRFYPSCSCYAEQALRTLKPMRAVKLVLGRLLRCHPLSGAQGFDPIPTVEQIGRGEDQ